MMECPHPVLEEYPDQDQPKPAPGAAGKEFDGTINEGQDLKFYFPEQQPSVATHLQSTTSLGNDRRIVPLNKGARYDGVLERTQSPVNDADRQYLKQELKKVSDAIRELVTNRSRTAGLPVEGEKLQVLAKNTGEDFDAAWYEVPDLLEEFFDDWFIPNYWMRLIREGGKPGHRITKCSEEEFDADWAPDSYDIGFYWPGLFEIDEIVLRFNMVRDVAIPATLDESKAELMLPGTGVTTFAVDVNSTQIALIEFQTGQTQGTLTLEETLPDFIAVDDKLTVRLVGGAAVGAEGLAVTFKLLKV